MINNLLVPTDFSKNAYTAFYYACKVAEKSGAKILLHHTFDDLLPSVDQSAAEIENAAKKNLEDLVNRAQADWRSSFPQVQINNTRGNLVSNLEKLASRTKADLIVMGTKGASGIKRMFMGSAAVAVINTVKCPTLIIPEQANFLPLQKIVFATDHQLVENKEALNTLKDLAMLFEAKVIALHIQDPQHELSEEQKLAKSREDYQLKPEVELVHQELNHSNLLEGLDVYLNEQGDVDVLAMLRYKHPWFEKLFSSTLTEEIAFHPDLPLLILHENR